VEAELTGTEGIDSIEDGWRELAELRGNAFLTPEWFRCWADSFGEGRELAVAAVRRPGGELAGVVPLELSGPPARPTARFAGSGLADLLHPAAAEQDDGAVAAAVVRALAGAGQRLHKAVLVNVESERRWWSAAREAGPRMVEVIQSRSELPFISLAGLDWEGYLAQRSSNFRAQVRRRERGLAEQGEPALRPATPETLERDMTTLFDLHERRWSGRGASSLAARRMREFLRAFAAAAQQRGWLRLHCLEVDGEAVAAFLGWRIGDRYAFYASGFAPEWKDRSVGFVLMAMTIRAAIEEGAAEFDMLLGGEAYKRRFAPASRQVESVVLVSANHPARALLASEAVARRIGRRLARNPRAGRVLRAVAAKLPSGWRN
jgi:CelD/BcsL family acetyltransferase involved in cellulose biosynthesis